MALLTGKRYLLMQVPAGQIDGWYTFPTCCRRKDAMKDMGFPVFFSSLNEKGLTLRDILATLKEQDDPFPNRSELQIILQPPTNSCQDLTDEDSGEEDTMNINNLPGTQLRAEAEIVISPDNAGEGLDEDDLHLAEQVVTNKRYMWKKKDIQPQEFHWPAFNEVKLGVSPMELFTQFFDESVFDMFVTYSNMYATKSNKVGNITLSEMTAYFGTLLLSGYVKLPRRRMFWENSRDTHNELVSNAIARNRFEFVMSNLHCCDNDNLSPNDRFAKVRPLIQLMNKNFQNYCPIHEMHSVDQSVVPYFGRHGCKQIIKGKPVRYGFKFWMGATSSSTCSGYCVWIEPYQGSNTRIANIYKPFGLGPSVILQYCDILSGIQNVPYHIFSDNFFTTVPLLEELLKRNIKATGTMREDRLSRCTIQTNGNMKKMSQGSFDYRSTENKVLVVKWNDNNIVTVGSNNLQVHPIHQVSRVSKKKKIMVDQPHCINKYYSFIGGVDKCDKNISYHRTAIRGKKWYFCIITYMLDLALQNAWHLYRLQGGVCDHLSFRRQVASTLLETCRSSRKRAQPSLENVESRFDSQAHYLIRQEKQTRCRQCHKKVKKKCVRCNVALHMDCFALYHQKEEFD